MTETFRASFFLRDAYGAFMVVGEGEDDSNSKEIIGKLKDTRR